MATALGSRTAAGLAAVACACDQGHDCGASGSHNGLRESCENQRAYGSLYCAPCKEAR